MSQTNFAPPQLNLPDKRPELCNIEQVNENERVVQTDAPQLNVQERNARNLLQVRNNKLVKKKILDYNKKCNNSQS